ncbi:MAG: MFS transporter [Deltaproteobacteria bacterium]|nr:MFS transporter [Deltaproteobacteria bacterium]
MEPTEKTGIRGNENGSALQLQLVPIIFLTAIFLLNFISRIELSPLVPSIENDMGIGHGEIGSFFFYITIGYFISLVGSGFISSRISHRMTIAISSIAVGLTLLGVCLTETVWGLGACMFVLGLVTGIYLPSGIATITNLVNPQQWGKALAIHELAPNLAFVMAPLVAEALMVWCSWRCVMGSLGLASLVIGIAYACLGRGGEFTGETPNFSSVRSVIGKPSFFAMVFFFGLAISSTLGIYSMLPLYLISDHAIMRTEANTLVALSRVSTLFIVFLGGWAADKFGASRTINVVFLITGSLTILLGVVPTSWIKLIVILQPVVAVCFFPAGFAMLSSTVAPQSRGLAVSLVIPLAFMIGAGIVPTFIGFMGDAGLFKMAFPLVGGFILSGGILLRFIKLR